ncbi:hypothetical protein BH10BDE1_BH10BDE1_32150 [soil metagenome]
MKNLLLSLSLFSLAFAGVISTSANAMSVRRQATRAAGTKTQVKMEVEVGNSPTNPNLALDILFVIDDSGSMQEHQANLLANVGDLVRAAQASGADIHAGVITTNMDSPIYNPSPGQHFKGELNGVNKPFAATLDGDFEKVLTENLKVSMTTNGSGTEQPFAAVTAALSEPLMSGANKDFIRPGAALAVFMLSDADDQSTMPVADFVTFLKGLKTKAPVTMHAAYIPTTDTTCNRSGEAPPARVEEALTAFGTLAESFSLCDAFGTHLSKIGEGYETIGLRTVQLKLIPDLSTMKITYGTETFPAADLLYGWVYDASKTQILFGNKINWFSQPADTHVFIEYFEK